MRSTRGDSRRALLLGAICCLLATSCGDPLADVRALHATGRYGQSIEPLRALLKDDRNDPELQYLYGVALLRNGQADLALWPLRRAIESPDWEVRAGVSLAQSAFRTRNWDGVVEASNRVLALQPDRLDALTLRAQARLEQKLSPELALEDFERALELSPGDTELLISKALTLINLERIDEAGAVFERLAQEAMLKLEPGEDDARACATLATFTKERGETDAAAAVYEECLKIFPASVVVVEEALQYFDKQKDSERSLQILRKALEVNPGLVVQRDDLARRLSTAGEVEAARGVLLEGTEIGDPAGAAYAWSVLADHHRGHDEYQEAAEAFGKALALEPNPAADRLIVYAELLGIAGRHDEALEVAKGLQEPIYVDLVEARRFAMQDNPRGALEHLDSVLLRWPNNAGARYQAARAAEKLGDFDRAIEEYRQSIRADSKKTDAGLRLGRLYEGLGMPERTLIAAKQYLNDYRVDVQGLRLAVRAASASNQASQLKLVFQNAASRQLWPEALSARAEWLSKSEKHEAAIELIRGAGLDFSDLRNAAALRALVSQLAASGRNDEAVEAVELALAANSGAAAFYEIQGMALETIGAPTARAEDAYRRALELQPEHPLALEGLARLANARGATPQAADFYRRALDAGALEPSTMRAAATTLAAAGRDQEAIEILDALLDEHPYDALAALQRAEHYLVLEPMETHRARRLARSALRFGGGTPAHELLGRIDAIPSGP